MIWFVGFIVFLFVEVFGALTRSLLLFLLGFMFIGSFICSWAEDGTISVALACVLIIILALAPFAVFLVPDKEKRNEEEKKVYGEILSDEDRAFIRKNGKEAFILKQLKDGNYFMLSGEEAKRKNQIGRIPWIREQHEKRKAMGEEKWFEGQKNSTNSGLNSKVS